MKSIIVGITAPSSVGLLKGQIKYFTSLGYNMYLMAPKTEQTLKFCVDEGATLLAIDIKREIRFWSDIVTLWQIIFHLYKTKPNIVNFGTPKISLLGIIAAKICGVKYRIYTCRGFRYESEKGWIRHLLIFFEKIISKFSHKVICISKSIQAKGYKDKIFDLSKTTVIGHGSSNGLDLDLFSQKRIDARLLNEYKQKYTGENVYVFGFVGRVVNRKGIIELIEAFSSLAKLRSNVKLLIVGPSEINKGSNRQIEDIICQHPHITWVGKRPFEEIPYFMSLFDCFVLPTWAEGFGNVLIQAAAMGVPVITNDVTGCRDAVKDDFNGILIKDVRNANVLRDTMCFIMDNTETAEMYGKNGLVWAEKFNQTYIWEGLRKLYDNREV